MKGILTLVPTPIDDKSPLESVAKTLLERAVENDEIIAIEDLKPGRRRWLSWGLPRSQVDNFILYNEHTWKEQSQQLFSSLNKGKNVFLMSDGGLPAYCDPGRHLVELCHLNNIKVTSTPFPHSIALALALSGFEITPYTFLGFPPIKDPERSEFLKKAFSLKHVSVLMDTPYRLDKMIEEIKEVSQGRGKAFLAMDLNQETEHCMLINLSKPLKFEKLGKREFILIICPS